MQAVKQLRPLEFDIKNNVLLKEAPIKGVMRFGMKRKLSSRYTGPFEMIKRIVEVANQ